mmetsp:Transcript_55012/g.128668  ORF Transcript_55012/g.128668 Transcript_55012/m.128668 type:complete len:251 (+) Transcript_55012:510-1262(+)
MPAQEDQQPQCLEERRLLSLFRCAVITQVLEGDLQQTLNERLLPKDTPLPRCWLRSCTGAFEQSMTGLLFHLLEQGCLLDLSHYSYKLLFAHPSVAIQVKHLKGGSNLQRSTWSKLVQDDSLRLDSYLLLGKLTVSVLIQPLEECFRCHSDVLEHPDELLQEVVRVGHGRIHVHNVLEEQIPNTSEHCLLSGDYEKGHGQGGVIQILLSAREEPLHQMINFLIRRGIVQPDKLDEGLNLDRAHTPTSVRV